jgi:hypothetical protein
VGGLQSGVHDPWPLRRRRGQLLGHGANRLGRDQADRVKERLLDVIATIKVGDVCDFRNFMNAVIDKAAFKTIAEYIDFAKADPNLEILCGGNYDDRTGYFIPPTVVLSRDPRSRLMCEEIFGPVLTVHVYPRAEFEQTMRVLHHFMNSADQQIPFLMRKAQRLREEISDLTELPKLSIAFSPDCFTWRTGCCGGLIFLLDFRSSVWREKARVSKIES